MNDQQIDPNMQQAIAAQTVQTILVTGATGFVGANLALHLAKHGHRVVAYDLAAPPAVVERFWQGADGQIVFEAGSVTDIKRLMEVAERHTPTAIVHAAAVTAVDFIAEARMATRIIEVNLMGTVRLLELAQRPEIRRMIYISSAGVYGTTDPQVLVPESAPLQINGLYMIAKETSERLCHRYAELFDLDVAIGRLGQPYGPMERDTGVRTVMSPIYQLARVALTRGTVRIPMPDYTCDWTYTLDLAEAVRLLIEAEALQHPVYNLSNGQSRRVSDVVAQLKLLIPGARFEWVGSDESADVDTRSDPRRGPLDILRLRQDVGYEPAYDLKQGLQAALPWWREMIEASP